MMDENKILTVRAGVSSRRRIVLLRNMWHARLAKRP